MSPDASHDSTTDPRPHPMAFRPDTACPRCGYGWFRPMALVTPDAAEFPIVAACARCRWYDADEREG